MKEQINMYLKKITEKRQTKDKKKTKSYSYHFEDADSGDKLTMVADRELDFPIDCPFRIEILCLQEKLKMEGK